MKVWLDDCRKPPPGYDAWAKTAEECIAYLARGDVLHVSLDHDLADEHMIDACSGYHDNVGVPRERYREKTGYDVILWMAETGNWPPDVTVHTANPVGRRDMLALLERHAPSVVAYRWIMPYERTVPWIMTSDALSDQMRGCLGVRVRKKQSRG